MLAVKLHKDRRPWLGKGCHLIPIVSWPAARVHIHEWMRVLPTNRRTVYPNTRTNYITLVKIPDDLPVCFRFCYGNSNWLKAICWSNEFKPLKDWPQDVKKAIGDWFDGSENWGPGGAAADEVEVILGAQLPSSCVKWTKDVRLLYGRKRRDGRPTEE